MSGILHEDASMVYCCQQHEITTKVLPSSAVISGCYDSQGDKHNVNEPQYYIIHTLHILF
jgi:hypothetical protein